MSRSGRRRSSGGCSPAPYLVAALPEMPRLLHQWLLKPPRRRRRRSGAGLATAERLQNRLLVLVAVLLAIAIVVMLVRPS